MKKLLIIAALLSSTSFAEAGRLPEPICVAGKLQYKDPGHFWQDFCNNGLGIMTPQECVKYQKEVDPEKLDKELMDFLKKKHAKICGE